MCRGALLSSFVLEPPSLRPLKLHLPEDAMPTCETCVKQTKEARVCRRAQAVREGGHGPRLQTVSEPLHFPYSALRTWGQRLDPEGIAGLTTRPRPGRPPQVPCALDKPLDRLIAPEPLPHGASHSPGRCQERAAVLARPTGVQRSRESGRAVFKKPRTAK